MWPYLHYSKHSPISETIITAERSNHEASHFPVSAKSNLLPEMSACVMECRRGDVCWKCQQGRGQIERGCSNPELTSQTTCCTFTHPQILLLWLPKEYLHAALNLWGSKMVFKLPPQKPWELFVSTCERPPNVFAVKTISLSPSQMLFDLTSI